MRAREPRRPRASHAGGAGDRGADNALAFQPFEHRAGDCEFEWRRLRTRYPYADARFREARKFAPTSLGDELIDTQCERHGWSPLARVPDQALGHAVQAWRRYDVGTRRDEYPLHRKCRPQPQLCVGGPDIPYDADSGSAEFSSFFAFSDNGGPRGHEKEIVKVTSSQSHGASLRDPRVEAPGEHQRAGRQQLTARADTWAGTQKREAISSSTCRFLGNGRRRTHEKENGGDLFQTPSNRPQRRSR
jgi:hypothetical protein